MSQLPVRWDVHYFFCQQARPEPKDKFVVIAHIDANWFYGFFINSEIKHFVTKRQLEPCMAPIAPHAHPFLTHNSWVDCTGAYTFPSDILSAETYRGPLDKNTITAVLHAVSVCRVIRQKQKALILTP